MTTALTVQNFGAVSVALDPQSAEIKAGLIAESSQIVAVRDDLMQQAAIDTMAQIKRVTASVEKSRKEVKEPVLALGKKIDALAKTYSAELDAEYSRLGGMVSKYEAEKQRKAREAEEARQAELRRIEEEKRKAQEEADRKAREAAEAAMAAKNAKDRAAAKKLADEAAAKLAQQKALEQQKTQVSTGFIEPSKAEGSIVREEWDFEVLNVAQVYAARPDLCRLEINRSAVLSALRAGPLDVAGLKTFKVTKVGVRR